MTIGKFYKFCVVALTLTVAALATPSAFGYTAIFQYSKGDSLHYFYPGTGDTQEEARKAADLNAAALRGDTDECRVSCAQATLISPVHFIRADDDVTPPVQQCIAFASCGGGEGGTCVRGVLHVGRGASYALATMNAINACNDSGPGVPQEGQCTAIAGNGRIGNDVQFTSLVHSGMIEAQLCDTTGLRCEEGSIKSGENCDPCGDNAVGNANQTQCVCEDSDNFVMDGDENCVFVECGDNSTPSDESGTMTCVANPGFSCDDSGRNCDCELPRELNGDGECLFPECDAGLVRIGDEGECAPECDAGMVRIDNKGECVPECDEGLEKIVAGGECIAKCADGLVRIDGGGEECVLPMCESGFERVDGVGECVQQCDVAATRENGLCVCGEGFVGNGVLCAENTTSASPPSAKDSDAKIFTAAMLGIIAYHAVAVLGTDNITWIPSYAVRHRGDNLSYVLGSRWTAAEDHWRYYWQTGRDNDEFVYGSGVRYDDGFLLAAMNSESDSDKTDLDLALSATQSLGVWEIGGGYHLDMQWTETAANTQNRLDISAGYNVGKWLLSAAAVHDTDNRLNVVARYQVDKWILSANANTDGDGGQAAINYSYRF